jgi:hypothetical protein
MLIVTRIAQAIFLATFVAWVSLGPLFVQSPILQPSKQPHEHSANTDRDNKNPSEKLDWHNWTHDPIAAFTGLLTAFNGLLFLSTIALWLATRKTAKISERALTELERAYVFVEEIKSNVDEFFVANFAWREGRDTPGFHFSVVNFGRTPANIEAAAILVEVLGTIPNPMTRLQITFANPDAAAVEIIIGPDRSYTFPSMKCAHIFTRAHVKAILSGTSHLYCHGIVTYLDIFMRRHTIKFCRKYVPRWEDWVPEGGRERNSSD